MLLTDFDYPLPEEQIAKFPAHPRDHCRLLQSHRGSTSFEHCFFYDLPKLLKPGDLLVLNDTKVLPARLIGRIEKSEAEVLLLDCLDREKNIWECLVRPGKKLNDARAVEFDSNVKAKRIGKTEGAYHLQFEGVEPNQFLSWVEQWGHLPIPPYLKRAANQSDKEDYQTIFADKLGSIAAPTAGLHFTHSLTEKLSQASIEMAHITLHVGYGTFAPIRENQLEAHQMHQEWYQIPESTADKITKTKRSGGRVIAVGTTTVRALESWEICGKIGKTDLFIQPGFKFLVVDGMITNFHLPKSSLLVLVSAFLGMASTKQAYQVAVESGYRFYSYGDAMLIV